MAGSYFCLEQSPTGGSTARTCVTLEDARAQMNEALSQFIRGEYYAKVNSLTIIIGSRDESNLVTGFHLVERVRIKRDHYLD
jgi:hypothetical protein